MFKTYQGSCHCGLVKFAADLDLSQPSYRCNCSICRRTRFWPAIARPEGFRLLADSDALTEYLFSARKNQHFFCRHCGVRAFGIGNDTPVGKMIGVNIGCLEGVTEEELSAIPIVYVDGLHDKWGPSRSSCRICKSVIHPTIRSHSECSLRWIAAGKRSAC